MIPYPHINPDLFTIGSFRVRWYGVMYVAGFLASYFVIKGQEKARPIGLSPRLVQDLMFHLAIGLIAGARLGYILFYQYMNLADFVRNPLEIIAVWHGGMSFHGGLIGTAIAGWWFCIRKALPFWAVADRVIVTAPIGLGLGRIGNFINGELYGRITELPWRMIFPEGGPLPRHPSQLYEAFMEGVVLFIVLWILRKKSFRHGMMIGFFLTLYGTFRFFLEFLREPDPQLGFIVGPLTMGQLLSAGMIGAGVLVILLLRTLR
ncbi:MAG: prolipoprotein diacylglyceryl transferase [Deltaproteobacteria bacterium]|jgi:phosphatidylglycerol:prolipoprotein diacylglycerol transferase|nr:prolipoprotein diacylglyceryl transferase [Deltaproteobacteria bacterium]